MRTAWLMPGRSGSRPRRHSIRAKITIARTASSTVLLGVLAVVIFALIECVQGREPDLPGLSQAVRMQLY